MIDKYLKPFAKAVGLHTSYWMFIMLVTVILYYTGIISFDTASYMVTPFMLYMFLAPIFYSEEKTGGFPKVG